MCYRNGYGYSYCGQDYAIMDGSDNVFRIYKGMSEDEMSEAMDILQDICDSLLEKQLHMADEDPVFMAAVTPGEAVRIITEDEADEYLPCYEEDDVIEQAPETGLVMSYDERLLFSVGKQKYLDGTFLIYAVDDDGDTVSLEAEDIYRLQKMVSDRTILITQGDEEMPVFSMN